MGLNMDSPDRIVFLIISFPLFLIAIMLHEYAHGYVAYLEGDDTAKYAGRLTLNPIDHLDVVGTLCFILTSFMGVGFGWAKPVPINPLNFRHFRSGIIRVSLAGVAANLMLVIAGSIALKIVVMISGSVHGNDRLVGYIVQMLFWFASFNMVLFVFNLIPIPPLDGSKVLMMLLPRQQAEALARIEPYGMFIIFGLLYLGVLRYVFHAAQLVLETVLFKVLAI